MATSKVDCDGFECWDQQAVSASGQSRDRQPSQSVSDHVDSDDVLARDLSHVVSCTLASVALFSVLSSVLFHFVAACSYIADNCVLLLDVGWRTWVEH